MAERPHLNYDEILGYIGQFGKYQKKIHFILWLVPMVSGVSAVAFAFTGYQPPYRCPVPFCDGNATTASYYEDAATKTFADYVTAAIPETSLKSSSYCQYRGLADDVLGSVSTCDGYLRELEDESKVVERTCDASDVIWDDGLVLNSVATEFDMACGEHYVRSIYNSLFMLGLLIGSPFFGLMSDRFGRMVALVASVAFLVLSALVSTFMPTKEGYMFFRFFTGMGCMGTFMVPFVLAVEYGGYKYTNLIGIFIHIPFAVGEMILGIDAYFIRDWKTLQLAAHVPWIVILLLWFIVPESPRWLIAANRHNEAIKVIHKVAEGNGKVVPEEVLEIREAQHLADPLTINEDPKPKPHVMDLFNSRPMLLRTLNMMFQWFAVTMAYYGLSFASVDLAGDKYSNFCLTAFIEIPAYLFAFFLMDCWGRRPLFSFCQIIAGVACIAAGLLFEVIDENPGLASLQVILALLGKFMASSCFGIVYIYTAELYPTIIRNTAIGSCSCIARVGGGLALLIGMLKVYWYPAPMIIMGVTATIAGFLGIFLPETVGTSLPETIDEAIAVGDKNANRSLFTFTCPKSLKEIYKPG